MDDGNRRDDAPVEEDHPQTIKLEDDARGGAETFRHLPEPPDYGTVREEASPIPAEVELGKDAEAVRKHAAGAVTIGEAVGSGPKPDVGSGTPPDRDALDSGNPPITEEGAEPLGSYTPGRSRD